MPDNWCILENINTYFHSLLLVLPLLSSSMSDLKTKLGNAVEMSLQQLTLCKPLIRSWQCCTLLSMGGVKTRRLIRPITLNMELSCSLALMDYELQIHSTLPDQFSHLFSNQHPQMSVQGGSMISQRTSLRSIFKYIIFQIIYLPSQ